MVPRIVISKGHNQNHGAFGLLLLLLLAVLVTMTSSFQVHVSHHHHQHQQQQEQQRMYTPSSHLYSTTMNDSEEMTDDMIVDVDFQNEPITAVMKRNNLIQMAKELRKKYGYLLNPLLVPRSTQKELIDTLIELEQDFMSTRQQVVELLPGDWELICTIPVLANTDTTKQQQQQQKQESPSIPSLFENEWIQKTFPSSLPIASLTNKFVTVTQRIKGDESVADEATMTKMINRIDHIIQINPPNQFNELLETVSPPTSTDASTSTSTKNNNLETIQSFIKNLNINPFEVKESKVILVHDAEVIEEDAAGVAETMTDVKRVQVRLNLQSIINNVAGSGGNLNPNGSNILSINVPQIDFLKQNKNVQEINDMIGGSFTTTYIDTEYRISRSTLLPALPKDNDNNNSVAFQPQQIRIFQKRTSPTMIKEDDDDDEMMADVDDIAIEPPSDVEE